MMKAKYTVGICDDEVSNREGWSEALSAIPGFNAQFEIKPIVAESKDNGEFSVALDGLAERRHLARKGQLKDLKPNLFDALDLLIVDYDLIDAAHGEWITGEEVAYLARCYSHCKVVVAINQFGSNPFDLNLTCHFPETFADINLGDSQVANPGLWQSEWNDGFRPWYWPLIPKLIADMDRRVAEVLANPSQTIKELLGFRDEAWRLLPRDTVAVFSNRKSSKPFDQLTISEVVTDSIIGLRPKDRLMNDEALARIAAARVSQWLDYAVLSAQDILVDAPHLVERYSSLTGSTKPSLDQLNKFAQIESPEALGLDSRLAEMAFKKTHWLSRPAWYWPEVSKASWIEEVQNPWGADTPDSFFCEDISRFLPLGQTREFRIRVPSVYDTRRCVDPVAEGAEVWTSLSSVDYQPNSRLMD
jgi:hypothetical protein